MSANSLYLRKRLNSMSKGLPASEYLKYVHKIDEIQRLEPRGGSGSDQYKCYWDVINRQLRYIGNDFLANLMAITPDFINRSFFYNEDPQKYSGDIKEPRHYHWGDTYDIKELNTEAGELPQALRHQ